ncbi:MAG: carnitine 3-dehydrogenase [Cohaesibacter sp.]|nr:carnitine 3-dehydrogenase [Cohaesibacter sp.]MCV6602548.1 carnitine 3-dehydrogenase [Cohaesibacter sp.]
MTYQIRKVAAVGGGVIGGGWIARFILNGYDVAIYDPHPEAERIVGEVLANAERAYGKLFQAPPIQKGQLTFACTMEEAVSDADYIQESVPERLDLKQKIYTEIEAHARPDALIGSSTSGFKPSELQEGMSHPERLFVAHPFNPVYLLPLVEIVPSEANDRVQIEKACTFLEEVGMKALVVRKEIDAHIADRLLEAVWREGLWLINDGVATTQEIDDAIRYGFGLRWAQMGLFETYRVAGGEAGMRHFISQFGPALQWPWTKLMDVPDLTEELIDRIACQSDAQSGHMSVRELERARDDNLVGILLALKGNDWGAGSIISEMDKRFYAKAHEDVDEREHDLSKPLELHKARVAGEWTDYNGHMTEHRYLQVLGDATDAFLTFIGMDEAYLAQGYSVYTVETHIRFLKEVPAGTEIRVRTQMLGCDEKRLRLSHEMIMGDDTIIATGEHMLMHVDTKASSACAFCSPLKENLKHINSAQKILTIPSFAGRAIRAVG